MVILPPENRDWQWLYSWGVLTVLEPRLLDLEQTLLDAGTLTTQEYETVFSTVRQWLARLLGWASGRRHPVLRSSNAYHAALAHLIEISEREEEMQ